jgi:hypothetical protein
MATDKKISELTGTFESPNGNNFGLSDLLNKVKNY